MPHRACLAESHKCVWYLQVQGGLNTLQVTKIGTLRVYTVQGDTGVKWM